MALGTHRKGPTWLWFSPARSCPSRDGCPTSSPDGCTSVTTAASTPSRSRAPGHPRASPTPPSSTRTASIYPGLIDLHSHTAYNTLPLWTEPGRIDPWAHHNSWTGAGSYHERVVWPTGVLGYAAGPALLAFIGLKALVGGTTSIQGSVSKPKLRYPWSIRVVENEAIGSRPDPFRAATLTTTDPAKLKPYVTGMTAGQGFIYHCAEGQPGTVVTKEYDTVGTALGLREELIAVHCTALTRADFDRWSPKAGTIVWSPFSNLWLYGMTTDVVAADRAGIRITLGSDWSPSGTKHLLGELKVADLHNRDALGRHFSDRRLVEMVTANPGAALSGPWEVETGRLVAGALADVMVVTRRERLEPVAQPDRRHRVRRPARRHRRHAAVRNRATDGRRRGAADGRRDGER